MSRKDKGKGRAPDAADSASERTPLLQGSTSNLNDDDAAVVETGDAGTPQSDIADSRSRRSIIAQLLGIFAVLLLIAFFILLILLAFVWATVRGAPASRQAPSSIVSHATRWRTTSISLRNTTGSSVSISVSGELGVDTEWVLGIDPDDDSAMASVKRATSRYLISALEGLHTNTPTTLSISDDNGAFLLNCTTPSGLDIPLRPNSRTGRIQMSNVTIPFDIVPNENVTSLVEFAKGVWLRGGAILSVSAPEVDVQSSSRPWWMPRPRRTMQDIQTGLRFQLPPIPKQFPQPGTPLDLNDILEVGSYELNVEDSKGVGQIGFSASARLLLPLDSAESAPIQFPSTLPTFPFLVSLPDPFFDSTLPFAQLATSPIFNTSSPLVSLTFPIKGTVLPFEPPILPSLSRFVSNYLGARPNTIILQSPRDSPTSLPFALPPTELQFPAPAEKPHILRSLTVKDMRIGASPSGEELTASGMLYASFGLPEALEGLLPRLDVRRVWPDTLVFDGPPPPELDHTSSSPSLLLPSANSDDLSRGKEKKPAPPLPDPLPERAFARIRTDDWLNSTTLPYGQVPPTHLLADSESESEGAVRWVSAHIDNAPLETLPGRDAEFQRFIRKILLSRGAGALAGVRGVASIALRLDGLDLLKGKKPSESDEAEDPLHLIELDGLQFEGSFIVGRRAHLDSILDLSMDDED